jgi:AraC-like DNA-binding protein
MVRPMDDVTLNQFRVFDSGMLGIRHLTARPASSGCGPFEEAVVAQLVLPLSGVFARHESARHHSIANSNHALFFDRHVPYRISYPGCIGDELLVLEFDSASLHEVLGECAAEHGMHGAGLLTHSLIPPAAILERNMLWRDLNAGSAQALAVEETGVRLLAAAFRAASPDLRRTPRNGIRETSARRRRQVEAVKEALSVSPQRAWTLDELACLAHSSPYHLSRIFSEQVGVPIHRYLLRIRLVQGLAAIADGQRDLTQVALDAGFASHSHFTSSFRKFFGVTPSAVRQAGSPQAMLLASS